MEWPPSEHVIKALLKREESTLLDFKREWYDLSHGQHKGAFVKDVLCMANSTQPDEAGMILVGKEDKKHGGQVIGIESAPDQETISQIMSRYTMPVPDVRVHQARIDKKNIGILGILWTSSFPYFAIRDVTGILSSQSVYIRRSNSNGELRPPEFLDLLRAKGKLEGMNIIEKSLQAGFVETGKWHTSNHPTVRVVNVSDSDINGLSLIFDISSKAKSTFFERVATLTDAPLKAGESREVECRLDQLSFLPDDERFDPGRYRHHKWLDITAHLRYRDRDGFLQQDSFTCSIALY